MLTSSIFKTLLLLSSSQKESRPKLIFDYKDLKEYIGFGLYQVGDRAMNYIILNLDKVLIGITLGTQAMGYYSLAFSLALQPLTRINPILTRVAFPVFAKLQRQKEHLKEGYLFLLQIISLINSPLCMGLAIVAPLLIPMVFGKQWIPAIPLVQILSLVALFWSFFQPSNALLLAKGRADLGFKWSFITLLMRVIGILIGIRLGGVIGAAVVLLILQIGYYGSSYFMLIKKLTGISFKGYVTSVFSSFILAGIMGLLTITVPYVFHSSLWLTLVSQILLGIILYLGLNYFYQFDKLLKVKNMLIYQ